MHKKIYFGIKPLLICDTISKEIKEQLPPDTLFTGEITPDAIKKMVHYLQQHGSTAGVIMNNYQDATMTSLQQELTLIKAAGGLVHTTGNEVLLIFRRGKWDLPKGKVEDGEDLSACAVREVEEETGLLHLQIEQPLTVTYHTYFEGTNHILKESHWFMMKAEKQLLKPQTEEDIERCEWVQLSTVAAYLDNTHPSIIDVLEAGTKVLQKNRQ